MGIFFFEACLLLIFLVCSYALDLCLLCVCFSVRLSVFLCVWLCFCYNLTIHGLMDGWTDAWIQIWTQCSLWLLGIPRVISVRRQQLHKIGFSCFKEEKGFTWEVFVPDLSRNNTSLDLEFILTTFSEILQGLYFAAL